MTSMLYRATRKILKALVRILHRKGMAFGEFSLLVKQVYVEVSEEALKADGERPTTSRIAIATGLTRKEVAQLRQAADEDELASTGSYNRGARVMTGWLQDAEFLDTEGKPAVLPVQGDVGSFAALVSRYSGDMPYRAMLREMERVGAVQEDEECVRLLGDGYIPHADEDEKLGILGTDVSALVGTIDHNLKVKTRQQLYFQRKVSYDNLPVEALPVFKEMVSKDGMDLLIRFNQWLAVQDRDSNPQASGSGRMRAGVGIYYFEEPVSKQADEGTTDED
ncbi:MAG: hypothetical protein HZT40_00715 [Candidatus Thiothrix singaporensis]|uniref:Uncharacterized protein n=1 Tax=Candidatus Thiothrix singaporensis TaxID=2799669 RepID=A0A7L6AMN9_9GAMM|nr:MAG: hypothetical protein HZT40_00715 [Candidatus Thiothrix singaporensis]